MSSFKDLTGLKFGRLTVIKRLENKNNSTQWLCRCDCGSSKDVILSAGILNYGSTKSCGCLKIEASSKNGKLNKKSNTYDLTGEYGIGYTTKGEEFYFDLEDYDKIKNYCWYKHRGYIETSIENNKIINMHRLVLNLLNDQKVPDHKNRIRYDNRKNNLRITTNSENAFNISRRKNNNSGVTGVYWEAQKEKWCATIYKNKKRVLRKYFTNKEDAIKARLEAELEYYDISPQKHLFKEYFKE